VSFGPVEDFQRKLIAAQGYCELGMHDDALEEVGTVPREVQRHPMVVEMRLVILMQARRWPEALQASLDLCELRPEAASGFIHAAFCLHEQGDTAAAKAKLMEGPPSMQHEANYFYNLACYECVLGNLEPARKFLATSVAMDEKYKDFAKTDPDLQGLRG
jgi:predicted Zn-dependent protease